MLSTLVAESKTEDLVEGKVHEVKYAGVVGDEDVENINQSMIQKEEAMALLLKPEY